MNYPVNRKMNKEEIALQKIIKYEKFALLTDFVMLCALIAESDSTALDIYFVAWIWMSAKESTEKNLKLAIQKLSNKQLDNINPYLLKMTIQWLISSFILWVIPFLIWGT